MSVRGVNASVSFVAGSDLSSSKHLAVKREPSKKTNFFLAGVLLIRILYI